MIPYQIPAQFDQQGVSKCTEPAIPIRGQNSWQSAGRDPKIISSGELNNDYPPTYLNPISGLSANAQKPRQCGGRINGRANERPVNVILMAVNPLCESNLWYLMDSLIIFLCRAHHYDSKTNTLASYISSNACETCYYSTYTKLKIWASTVWQYYD